MLVVQCFNIIEAAATRLGTIVARGVGEVIVTVIQSGTAQGIAKEEFKRWSVGDPSPTAGFVRTVRASRARAKAGGRQGPVYDNDTNARPSSSGVFGRAIGAAKRRFFVSPTQNDVHKVGLNTPRKKSVKHRHKNVVGAIRTHRHTSGDKNIIVIQICRSI